MDGVALLVKYLGSYLYLGSYHYNDLLVLLVLYHYHDFYEQLLCGVVCGYGQE